MESKYTITVSSTECVWLEIHSKTPEYVSVNKNTYLHTDKPTICQLVFVVCLWNCAWIIFKYLFYSESCSFVPDKPGQAGPMLIFCVEFPHPKNVEVLYRQCAAWNNMWPTLAKGRQSRSEDHEITGENTTQASFCQFIVFEFVQIVGRLFYHIRTAHSSIWPIHDFN